MKKFVLGFCFLFAFFAVGVQNTAVSTYAEESVVTPTSLTNGNFSTIAESGKYILTENITLDAQSWTPLENFSGELDGNGYKITFNFDDDFTKDYCCLFEELSENSIIENLGVVFNTKGTFKISNSISNDSFGLLAREAHSSTIQNCFVKADFDLTVNSYAYVGALVGAVYEGTIIENCFVNSNIKVTEKSYSATNVYIGGFVGYCNNSKIHNCFSVGGVNACIDFDVDECQTRFLLGGFVGFAVNGGNLEIVNCATTTTVVYQDDLTNVFAGKIFGSVSVCGDTQISYVYTANASQEHSLVGQLNSCELNSIFQKDANTFNATFFSETQNWSTFYEWDFDSTWCTKTSEWGVPVVLQVFEEFNVAIRANEQVSSIIYKKEGGEYVAVDGLSVSFKFGAEVKINIEVVDEFKSYETISALNLNSDNEHLKTFDNKTIVDFEFVLTGEYAGTYEVVTKDIDYNLVIETANENYGLVKYPYSNSSHPQLKQTVQYNGTYSFSAQPLNNSYAFEKWVWVVDGEEQDAVSTTKLISLKFAPEEDDSTYIYFNLDTEPKLYTEDEDGTKTFTLRAIFTAHTGILTIKSNLLTSVCSIKVEGEEVAITDPEVLFSGAVQIGKEIEIEIYGINEKYSFKNWEMQLGKNFSTYAKEGDTENSLILHLNLSGDLELTANFEKETKSDFNWLIVAYIGGGLGIAGLVTFAIIAVVRKNKKDDYLNYY